MVVLEQKEIYISEELGATHILACADNFYMFGPESNLRNFYGFPVQDCGTKEEVVDRLESLAKLELEQSENFRTLYPPQARFKKVLSEFHLECAEILKGLP